VYRFLRENGCRWLYPGVDGDYVPIRDIEGVQYHKLADHRFRGFCNEGSESQTCMLECADYYAKPEMNVYMLEWFVPNGYYNRYYTHLHNDKNRIPEPVDDAQILQWKRQTEVEIAKRGLMFHDIGHGWTSRPFGFPNEFPVYIYAATLMDRDCNFNPVKEDYFAHIYGPDWKLAARLLQQISDTFDFAYMEGERSKDESISPYYDPDRVGQLSDIMELCAQERALANKHLTTPTRPQTMSWRLLLRHAKYCELRAQILIEKALGHNAKAVELSKEFCHVFGRHELEIERYYDHSLACRVLEHITRNTQKIILD